jgi:hypothetical protein
MSDLRINIAADINRLHELANKSADEAVDFAKQAGLLLMEAKAAVQHGEWEDWLAENVWFSPRQARRYMQVAQGRALPARSVATAIPAAPAKTDTVTVLKDWMPRPSFIPVVGHSCWCASDDSEIGYLVEPSMNQPGFFFLSHFSDDGCACLYLTRPIRADFVETWLKSEGLADPARAKWRIQPCDGVDRAGVSIGVPGEALV